MRTIASVMFVVGLVGCGSSQPSPREPSRHDIVAEYQKRIDRTQDAMRSRIWWPDCQSRRFPGRGCGLLSDRLTPEWTNSFVRDVCKQDPSEDLTPECRKAIHDKVIAAFERRYTRSKEADVWAECNRRADEGICASYQNVERLFMSSHNATVMSEANAHIRHLRQERKQHLVAERREREVRERDAQQDAAVFAAVAGTLLGVATGTSGSPAPPLIPAMVGTGK